MKTVVVLQSNYLPWKGYFDLIHDADLFVFYDDSQYTKNDWRNRNRIKSANGSDWITVPVGSDIDRLICDVGIQDYNWQKKHWKTLVQNYGGSPYFSIFRSFFEDFYLGRRWDNLSSMNQYLISHISREFLGLKTAFHDSRSYSLSGKRQERLLELLGKVGANRYVSGAAAKSYIDPVCFENSNVELVWKDYSGYPEYPQRFSPFQHAVSIVDLLFNVGMDAPWYIWGWRES